ncbi:hypothetical protein DSL72_003211 [Monilinia vaccinii-corymbosi]|uniref:Uncharacterized protein n=1 Tax=Monilinia vaccinii-corymbosi TaxID=61207 RepID=A0A8A3P1N9_9HELO|nr:hypothetical protein DSL72_003211 [Monilinia vaccinii-corymbosi]
MAHENWVADEQYYLDEEFQGLIDHETRAFKELHDRKQAWIQKKEAKTPPGKIVTWFGKHEGRLLEDLEDGYVMALINIFNRDGDNAHPNIWKFKELYDRYNDWLVAEKIRTWRSPGSIPIWFGQDKGQEFRKVYKDQPRKWRWLQENTRWAPLLKAIAREYEAWLSTHRRNEPAARSAPNIVHPVGERLGPNDDGGASDIGSYESDDAQTPRSS